MLYPHHVLKLFELFVGGAICKCLNFVACVTQQYLVSATHLPINRPTDRPTRRTTNRPSYSYLYEMNERAVQNDKLTEWQKDFPMTERQSLQHSAIHSHRWMTRDFGITKLLLLLSLSFCFALFAFGHCVAGIRLWRKFALEFNLFVELADQRQL